MFTFDITIDTDFTEVLSKIRGGLVGWTPCYGYIRFRNNQFQVAEPFVAAHKLFWQDISESELRSDIDQAIEWVNA